MRVATPVQVAALIAVAGSALAAGVPTFVNNLHASRLAEPMDGLGKIAARASALAVSGPVENAYPGSVPLTPGSVAQGQAAEDPPGTWDHPTWRLLDFGFKVPHRFSFEFTSANGAERSEFRAVAHGDLDGDGVLSTFSLGGQVERGSVPTVGYLELDREIE